MNLILAQHKTAVKAWEPILAKLAAPQESPVGSDKVSEVFAGWMSELDIGGKSERSSAEHVDELDVIGPLELYCCSWCKAPSAMHKKCSNCTKAR
jgi:hypothetical protein